MESSFFPIILYINCLISSNDLFLMTISGQIAFTSSPTFWLPSSGFPHSTTHRTGLSHSSVFAFRGRKKRCVWNKNHLWRVGRLIGILMNHASERKIIIVLCLRVVCWDNLCLVLRFCNFKLYSVKAYFILNLLKFGKEMARSQFENSAIFVHCFPITNKFKVTQFTVDFVHLID